jgi:DNA-binding response OmpR family regulator
MRLLLVEDEKDLSNSIVEYITEEGFSCDVAFNFNEASHKINLYEYDCLIIDIMLPGGSGLDLISEIKKINPKTGIVVISAKNTVDDKISGLEIGADDYLTKPFNLAELNARIRSVLRRRNFEGQNKIGINEIKIYPDKKEFLIHDKKVDLTKKEFEILMYLIINKEKVLTKESIAEYVWGEDSNTFDNLDFVYTHVKNLRKKMNENKSKDYIKSVYGIGYKFSLQ